MDNTVTEKEALFITITLLKELQKENEKLIEFVKDCSVSHHETRYKYRAQVIINRIQGTIDEKNN